MTAISIPVSVLITFIGMLAAGYSLNILTLGALTIAIGRVVDDSIVVIENIKRHLGSGDDRRDDRAGVREVAVAITASTVTTVAVFLPLALVGGITGELFRPFALTVTIALAASLFVSLTIVPVLAYWFLKPAKLHKHEDAAEVAAAAIVDGGSPHGSAVDELEHPLGACSTGYLPIIEWTRAAPAGHASGAAALDPRRHARRSRSPLMPTNFSATAGQNTLQVTQTLPAGTSLERRGCGGAVSRGRPRRRRRRRDGAGLDRIERRSSLAAAFGGGGSTHLLDHDRRRRRPGGAAADVREPPRRARRCGRGHARAPAAASPRTTSRSRSRRPTPRTRRRDRRGRSSERDSTHHAGRDEPLRGAAFIAIDVDPGEARPPGSREVAVGGIVAEAMQPQSSGPVAIDDKTLTIYIDTRPAAHHPGAPALQIPTRPASCRSTPRDRRGGRGAVVASPRSAACAARPSRSPPTRRHRHGLGHRAGGARRPRPSRWRDRRARRRHAEQSARSGSWASRCSRPS